MDTSWFFMLRVKWLLVSPSFCWVWETWSKTWRGRRDQDFTCSFWIGVLADFLKINTGFGLSNLLLAHYLSLDVFKFPLQLPDLLTVQRHVQAGRGI